MFKFVVCIVFVVATNVYSGGQVHAKDVISVLTVATDDNHGLQRFLRSAEIYKIPIEILGKGLKWTGGNMNYAGGGQKVNLLKEKLNELMKQEGHQDHLILFTDSYDVMFLSELENIIKKFKALPDTRVLFSAESFCWPDTSLITKYPKTAGPNPYLNSGGFIGYLPELLEILNSKSIKDNEDDQLFYTHVYLDGDLRNTLKIKLDHNSAIFQNLNGALSLPWISQNRTEWAEDEQGFAQKLKSIADVQLKANETDKWPYIVNEATGETPLIVHGNGPVKVTLNYLGNYLAKAWSKSEGCQICKEKKIVLKEEALPSVMMAVFIEQPTPFMEDFLKQLLEIDYPKDKIQLIIHNNVEYHEKEIKKFYEENSKTFATAKRIKPNDFISEAEGRNIAMERCLGSACDYLFSIDSLSRLDSKTLRYLLSSGFDVIAPMITRSGQVWSNFWGAINQNGFYARSADYMDIVNNNIRGIWNVPFITNCYLVKADILKTDKGKLISYSEEGVDPDMAFCSSLRQLGVHMHVSNEADFGHLINPESFDIARMHPDIYQVIDNKYDWEKRYLHEEYATNFAEGREHLMPCPDVYWFPTMSMRFCQEWIDVMENFGQWSDGTNYDKRLESGYEAVPTRDIHMKQVGLERQWLHILKEYVRPLQEMVFIGYYHDPPNSLMNFVVRYRPDEQPELRPHHDSSTYTINLALNIPNIDYEGGGCRFIRYNCSVKDTRPGWLLMHPGRLTHYHEGLRVTKGTRYIMISFVDP